MVAGNQEGRIAKVNIVAGENIVVGIVGQVEQRRGVVVHRAAGKLPLAVCKALVKTTHNPHLVFHQNWFGEGEKGKHSVANVRINSK